MTNDAIGPSKTTPEQFDKLIELQRLKNEGQRVYLDRWKADLEPVEKSIITYHQSAVGFGQASMKALLLLNGGAFIALPAFAKLFDVQPFPKFGVIIASVFFSLGLVACCGGLLFAFFTTNAMAEEKHFERERRALRLNAELNPTSEEYKDSDIKLKGLEENRRGKNNDAAQCQRIAIWCVIGALAFFIIGATVSVVSLS